jgi:nucleoside-diphosphate-sugar epimerase
MMRVLVTGARGLIGGAVVALLKAENFEVVRYDIADGDDILNARAVTAAAKGCDAIVHAAGGRGGGHEPTSEVITHNVTGNWNALNAAKQHGIGRVVTFSSVNALGCFRGETKPDYLPIDDDHPTRPPTAYGMSKRLIEEMCRCFTLTTGIGTVVFRPPAVLGPVRHAQYVAARAADPAAEWTPFWEYGAYIDVRDVAGAVLAALRHPGPGHLTALITADDTSSPVPVRDLARRLLPEIPWRGQEPADPAAPIVLADRAKKYLGWSPRYRWHDGGATT